MHLHATVYQRSDIALNVPQWTRDHCHCSAIKSVFIFIGQFDNAVGDFSKAIQIDPNSAAALTDRALAYRQMGRNDAALADFNRAIAANANHAPAYLGRANLERVQGQLDRAKTDLDTAIRLNPESAQAFHARGLIFQREGNQTAAITAKRVRNPQKNVGRASVLGTIACAILYIVVTAAIMGLVPHHALVNNTAPFVTMRSLATCGLETMTKS